MGRMTNLSMPYTAQKLVAVSGTPVQLAAQAVPPGVKVVVKAMTTNTGTVTLGNSSANSLNSGSTHFKLLGGQSLEFQVQNTNSIWLDATVSGEGVEVAFDL